MKSSPIRYLAFLAACLIVAVLSFSCSYNDDFELTVSQNNSSQSRVPIKESRNVFLIYSMGFNDLNYHLTQDIMDIENSWLPGDTRLENVVLVFSHSTNGAYTVQNAPVLFRMYQNPDGLVARDTLLVMDANTISASEETMNYVLSYIHDKFPAANYGMLISSHATGWLPPGYSSDPGEMEQLYLNGQIELPHSGINKSRSIGCQFTGSGKSIEMDMTLTADSFPFKLDYIIFDACFMGGVEVAYELRNACDKIVFSQTEILAEGMDYTTMTDYLLKDSAPDLIGFCENYFNFYNSKTGVNQSATISLIDCNKLEPLAMVCKEIFSSYRHDIINTKKSLLQQYFQSHNETYHGWFYDLESIVTCAVDDIDMLDRFEAALDDCVTFKAATKFFLNSFEIKTSCGLSMYHPITHKVYLNDYYKILEWNKATSLLE